MPCNPNLTVDKHPGSCGMAWAAEAARRQGRFWVFYDVLFSLNLDAGDAAIGHHAKEAGLDLARFEADWHGQAIKAKVNSDIELGRRLGVDATPAVFLNERRVRYMRREILEFLIEQQLEVD
jgi:protein-disulfide isomerase